MLPTMDHEEQGLFSQIKSASYILLYYMSSLIEKSLWQQIYFIFLKMLQNAQDRECTRASSVVLTPSQNAEPALLKGLELRII